MQPSMNTTMVYDPSYIVFGAGPSCLFYLCVFKLISPAVSEILWPKYITLTLATRTEWDNRFTSNINAVLCSVFSAYALCFEEAVHEDKLFHDSFCARLACALLTGYVIADTVCMIFWVRYSPDMFVAYLFHHAVTVYAYYYVSSYGVFCYFAMLRLTSEMSTPSVNQRWFFDVLDISRKETIVLQNGVAMFLTFLVFRIFPIPLYWTEVYYVRDLPGYDELGYIKPILYVPGVVLDSLNVFWFCKVCRGVSKAVRERCHCYPVKAKTG